MPMPAGQRTRTQTSAARMLAVDFGTDPTGHGSDGEETVDRAWAARRGNGNVDRRSEASGEKAMPAASRRLAVRMRTGSDARVARRSISRVVGPNATVAPSAVV